MNPTMLLINTTAFSMVQIIITSSVGIFGIAAAMNGFLFKPMHPVVRLLIAAAGIMMMDPGVATDIVGIALFAAMFLYQYLSARKTAAA